MSEFSSKLPQNIFDNFYISSSIRVDHFSLKKLTVNFSSIVIQLCYFSPAKPPKYSLRSQYCKINPAAFWLVIFSYFFTFALKCTPSKVKAVFWAINRVKTVRNKLSLKIYNIIFKGVVGSGNEKFNQNRHMF